MKYRLHPGVPILAEDTNCKSMIQIRQFSRKILKQVYFISLHLSNKDKRKLQS